MHEDFGIFTHEMEHNWQLIRRGAWQRERPNRRMEMMMKEMRQNCQMMKIQACETEMTMRQERLWHGDVDITICGGVNGIGSKALEEQCKGGD